MPRGYSRPEGAVPCHHWFDLFIIIWTYLLASLIFSPHNFNHLLRAKHKTYQHKWLKPETFPSPSLCFAIAATSTILLVQCPYPNHYLPPSRSIPISTTNPVFVTRSFGKGEGHGWELGRAHEVCKRGKDRLTKEYMGSAGVGKDGGRG
jgi:hypothetical protein